ncbi:MAG TPA: hypothetical protein VF912_13715 [Anaeromyxobacter sp.]
MTKTYESGSTVPSGFYLDAASWHLAPVANDGDHLPGGRGRWMRVPTALAVTLAPVLGAAFVAFLPVIGILVTLRALASAMANVFHRSATDLAATVAPAWQPGEAHFTGRHASPRVERWEPTPEDRLEALAEEIRRRRNV